MISKKPLKHPFLSVIIPCYNEAGNLESGRLDSVIDYLSSRPYRSEIIVVNDGCTDGSAQSLFQAEKSCPDLRTVTISHSGKPAALWAGIQEARGDLILLADMDQSTPISELEKLLPWFERGFDAVIGSRGRAREGVSILRRIGSYLFGHLRRRILLHDIVDTQCGFKAMRRTIALEVFPKLGYILAKTRPEGWKVTAFDVELLYLIEKLGYGIKEVDVEWHDRDLSNTKRSSQRHRQYIKESVEMAREVLRVKRNERKGFYEQLK